MTTTLSDTEVRALRRALDSYLPELRYELARIKLPSYRHDMVTLEETLTALRRRLGEGTAAEAQVVSIEGAIEPLP